LSLFAHGNVHIGRKTPNRGVVILKENAKEDGPFDEGNSCFSQPSDITKCGNNGIHRLPRKKRREGGRWVEQGKSGEVSA